MTAVSQLDAQFPVQDEDFVSLHLLKGEAAVTTQDRAHPAPSAIDLPQTQPADSDNAAPVCHKCRVPARPCINVLTKRQRRRASRLVWACELCGRRLICCIWRCGAVYNASSSYYLRRHEEDRCPKRPTPVEPSPPAATSSDEEETLSSADANDVLRRGTNTQLSKLWLASGARNRKRKRRHKRNITMYNAEEEDSIDDSSARPSDCSLSSASDDVTVRVHWCREVATNTQPEGALSFVGCRVREADGRIAKVAAFVPVDQLWTCIREDDGSVFISQRDDLIAAINRLPATPQKCSQKDFSSLDSTPACPLQPIENLPEFGAASEVSSCSECSDDNAAQGPWQKLPQFTHMPGQPRNPNGPLDKTQPSPRPPGEISGLRGNTLNQLSGPGGVRDKTQPSPHEQRKTSPACEDKPALSRSRRGPAKSTQSCDQQPSRDFRQGHAPLQSSSLPADNTQSCVSQSSTNFPQYADVQCAVAPEQSNSVKRVLADANACSARTSTHFAHCTNTPQQRSAPLSHLENTQACWQQQRDDVAQHVATTPEHSSCSPDGLRPLDNTPPCAQLSKDSLLPQAETPPHARRQPNCVSQLDDPTPPPPQLSYQRQPSDSPTVLSPSPLGNRGASASPALRHLTDSTCPPPLPALANNDISKPPQHKRSCRRPAKKRTTVAVPQPRDRPISQETNHPPAAGRARRARVCAAKPKDYTARMYDRMLKRSF